MAIHRSPALADDDSDEINLTPMLDVVFIMLIFFIVAASFVREDGLDLSSSDSVRMPKASSDGIVIAIDESSRILIDGRLIDPRAVRANVERLHAERPRASVVIDAHRKSANRVLVQVMDASRQAGVYDIALAE